jgi:5-methylcytosine-specific restriction endonuclease McrA
MYLEGSNYNMTDDYFLKRCPKCGETKLSDQFSRDRTKKDGHKSHCKACVLLKDMSEYKRNYERENAEKISARKRAYYIANKEKIRKVHRTYYLANTETTLRRQRVRYMNNREQILERDRAREKNRRDVRRAINHRRRAKMKAVGGVFTAQELSAMRLVQAGVCAYCERQYDPDALTIDHIIPIDQRGLTKPPISALRVRSATRANAIARLNSGQIAGIGAMLHTIDQKEKSALMQAFNPTPGRSPLRREGSRTQLKPLLVQTKPR